MDKGTLEFVGNMSHGYTDEGYREVHITSDDGEIFIEPLDVLFSDIPDARVKITVEWEAYK